MNLMLMYLDPNTDTTADDFQQDLEITVASLHTKSDTQ
jgi:hypothetical protein